MRAQAEEHGRKECRKKILNGTPQYETRSDLLAKHVCKEKRKATLSATGTSRKRNCRGEKFQHGAGRQAGQKIRRLSEGIQHKVRQGVKTSQLKKGNDKYDAHLRNIFSGIFESGRKLMYLRINNLMPMVIAFYNAKT